MNIRVITSVHYYFFFVTDRVCFNAAGGNLKVRHFGAEPEASSEETPAAERPGEATTQTTEGTTQKNHAVLLMHVFNHGCLLHLVATGENCSPFCQAIRTFSGKARRLRLYLC